jgi:chromosome condensin MukBEF MukE localization factor
MSEDKLTNIQDLLEDIKAILMLSNSKTIQEAKQQLLKEGSEHKKIYDLCDGKTTQEIATTLQKSLEYVNSNLSLLRRKGLIKTIEKDGKKIHEQRF